MDSSSHPLFECLKDAPSTVSPRRGYSDEGIIDGDSLLKERSRSPRELFDSRLQNPAFNDFIDTRLQNLVSNALSSHPVQFQSEPVISDTTIQNDANAALNNTGLVDFLKSSHDQIMGLKRSQEETASAANKLVGELSRSITSLTQTLHLHEEVFARQNSVDNANMNDIRQEKFENDQRAAVLHGRQSRVLQSLGEVKLEK